MRYVIAAVAALLIFSACGDDAKKPNEESSATAQQTTAPAGLEQPTAPDQALPTPTPVPADGVVVQIVGATGDPIAATAADVAALPQSEVSVDGTSYRGVSLGELTAKVKPATGAMVTISGVRADGKRQGTVRFKLEDIASSTVLQLNKTGQLSVASTSIPKDQWLIWVTAISLR